MDTHNLAGGPLLKEAHQAKVAVHFNATLLLVREADRTDTGVVHFCLRGDKLGRAEARPQPDLFLERS